MTEERWLTASDPRPLLEFLEGKSAERNRRLFAIGCCRLIRHHFSDTIWDALAVVERHADGEAHEDEFRRARKTIEGEFLSLGERVEEMEWFLGLPGLPPEDREYCLREPEQKSPRFSAAAVAHWASTHGVGAYGSSLPEDLDELGCSPDAAADILRDIFGNPFRPVTIDPAWWTPNPVMLAQAIYDERAFDRMPILGDALEEAGCDNADILSHCRLDTVHVRGCWVVDATLGRS